MTKSLSYRLSKGTPQSCRTSKTMTTQWKHCYMTRYICQKTPTTYLAKGTKIKPRKIQWSTKRKQNRKKNFKIPEVLRITRNSRGRTHTVTDPYLSRFTAANLVRRLATDNNNHMPKKWNIT